MEHNQEHIRLLMMERMAGTITEPENEVLEQLIRDNTTIREQWQELQAVFNTAQAKAALSTLDERQQRVWSHIDQERDHRVITARRRFPMTKIAVAASILGVMAAGMLYFLAKQNNSTPVQAHALQQVQLQLANGQTINISGAEADTISLGAAQLQHANKTLSYKVTDNSNTGINALTVPVGMDYKILLADGTEIWLNSVTTLRFPFKFTGNTREISINGEAYLKVAKDEQHPFIVHMPHSTVQVLGTAFNVNSYDSGVVKVSLVAGAVQLKGNNSAAMLKPGQEGVYAVGKTIAVQPFDEKDILSWMQGVHVFYNATMEEINTVLSRWYGITVELDNPRLAKEQFTGFIERNKPVSVFLEKMKMTTAVDYYFEGQVLHLK